MTKVNVSENLMIELRNSGFIHDWTTEGNVLPCFATTEGDWTTLEDIIYYILWLHKGETEKETWYDDNCPI